MHILRLSAFSICLSIMLAACVAPPNVDAQSSQHFEQIELLYPYLLGVDPGQSGDFADPFIGELAEHTWAYIGSDWARENHLPRSWRSDQMSGGDYANTAEIGLLALSWMAAYDLGQSWSPDWEETESEVMAILTQLRNWQIGSQESQPHGPNAYDNGAFFQWYWISWDPPVVSGSPADQTVPSVDNAWLAAALMTIRSYAIVHSHDQMADLADAILSDLDFSIWFNNESALFYWGSHEPNAGLVADYYSNENRIINFVARALGHLTDEEFRRSLDAMTQQPGTYGDAVVEKMAYDGSYFTYTTPALFIDEMAEDYGESTIVPATQAQIMYADTQGYDVWGLSDCYDIAEGEYMGQGAPPVAMLGTPESRPGLVTPHASALALITPLAENAAANLVRIAETYPCAYHAEYGFVDSVLAGSLGDGECSYRFSALAQEWLFLGIVNHHSDFVRRYFYLDLGVIQTHNEMFGYDLYLPILSK